MASVAAPASNTDPGAWYLVIGAILGWIAGALTFVGAWIYCIAEYGFLLGVGLGWIPAGICASIVGTLVCFLWGLVALAALLWAINSARPSGAPAAEPSVAVSPAEPQAWSPPVATGGSTGSTTDHAEASPLPPPPPDPVTVKRALAEFRKSQTKGGIAAAVAAVMRCYGNLGRESSWSEWDYCATLDALGSQYASQAAGQLGGANSGSGYFADTSVSRRQLQAAQNIVFDYNNNLDRLAALSAVVDQALADETVEQPSSSPRAATPLVDAAASSGPSFNCARARSASVVLVCNTPQLAHADQEMAVAYRAAMESTAAVAALKQSQREWIRRRNTSPADVSALAALYAERTAQLRAVRWDAYEHP